MKMAVSVLIVGASLLASAPASAAEYIQFTLYARGTATTTTFTGGSSTPASTTRSADATVTYIAPLFDYPSFSTYSKTASQEKSTHTIVNGATGKSSVSADSNILSFDESVLAHHSSQQFTAVIFGESIGQTQSIGNAFPTTSFNVSYGAGRLDASTGVVANNIVNEYFAGSIFRVDIARFDSVANPLSITNTVIAISPVPEPASWAMMLVGFAVVGASVRRRARVTATA